MPKIITNNKTNWFFKLQLAFCTFQTTTFSESCFVKLLSDIFLKKIYLYFSIGNGQPGELALCQLYRHTFVPYAPFATGNKHTGHDACRFLGCQWFCLNADSVRQPIRVDQLRQVSHTWTMNSWKWLRCRRWRPGCRAICPRIAHLLMHIHRVTQGPDLQNILRQSYDYLTIMPKLRSTYDRRLTHKRTQGFSQVQFTCKIVKSSETVFVQ